jgi:uncharacterized protein (TIGR02452 family)
MSKYTREDKITVQKDTFDIFKNGIYINSKDEKIILDKEIIKQSIENTCKIKSKNIIIGENTKKNTKIFLVSADCLEVGIVLSEKYSVGHLNMASYSRPGGGYITGASAQEESVMRRSNCHLCIDPINFSQTTSSYTNKYDNCKDTNLYPIKYDEIIYVPNMMVIKHCEMLKYKLLDKPILINALVCPAIKKFHYQKFDEEDIKMTEYKIDLILRTAIKYKHTAVVLGAFGCGAYHNPPEIIANICNRVVKKYDGYFDIIVYAIINDQNGKYNVESFSKILNQKPIKLQELRTLI